jgi:hypothetical protein
LKLALAIDGRIVAGFHIDGRTIERISSSSVVCLLAFLNVAGALQISNESFLGECLADPKLFWRRIDSG